jgi:hypothetical protein
MATESCGGSNNELLKALGIAGTLVFVAQLMKRLFKVPPTPTPPITKEEILLGARFRKPFSAIDTASKIIERQKKLGIPIGPLPSGAENIYTKAKAVEIEEIYDAILTKLTMKGAVPPIKVVVTGGNAGGPITAVGSTVEIGDVTAIPSPNGVK